MLLVVGLGLAGAGVLLFMAALRIFRRPQPPGWLLQGVGGDLMTVTVIGLVTMGVGFIAKFFADLPAQAFGLSEALWSVAVLAALLVVGSRLRARRAAPAAQPVPEGATAVPLAANDDPSPRPRGAPAGRGGRSKRAA